jgi:hypothetical protein
MSGNTPGARRSNTISNAAHGHSHGSDKHRKQRAQCPVCRNTYDDIRWHVQNAHTDHQFSALELEPLGFVACECGQACASQSGKARHLNGALHSKRVAALAAAAPIGGPQGETGPPSGCPLDTLDAESFVETLFTMKGVHEPLAPHVQPLFVDCANRLAAAYLKDPTAERLRHVLGVVKGVLARNLHTSRFRTLRSCLEFFPRVPWPAAPAPRPATLRPVDRAKRAAKLVEQGRIGRAARVLTETTSLAPATQETVDLLQDLHPDGPKHPFGDKEGPACKIRVTHAMVAAALKTFPVDTAPGYSGWDHHLFSLCFQPDTPFAEFVTTLVQPTARPPAESSSSRPASLPLRRS